MSDNSCLEYNDQNEKNEDEGDYSDCAPYLLAGDCVVEARRTVLLGLSRYLIQSPFRLVQTRSSPVHRSVGVFQ